MNEETSKPSALKLQGKERAVVVTEGKVSEGLSASEAASRKKALVEQGKPATIKQQLHG